MPQWSQLISEHRVWNQLELLGAAVDRASANDNIDPESRSLVERIRSILAFVGRRLASTDQPLLRIPVLEQIANSFAAVVSELDALGSNLNGQHAVNASSHADSALASAAQLVPATTPEEFAVLRTASADYLGSLERQGARAQQLIEELERSANALRPSLDQLAADVTAEQARNRDFSIELQRQLTEAQASRQQEYAETLRTVQARLDQVVSDQQSQFSAAQDSRSAEFGAGQTSRQEKFAALLEENSRRLQDVAADAGRALDKTVRDEESKLAELQSDYRGKAERILQAVEEHKNQVEKLVGVIGNLGVTSGYVTTANQARKSMWLWQTVAVLAMLGLIAFGYFAFLPVLNGAFTWEGFAGRVVLTVTVGVLAAYAAKQADNFLQDERRNRRLALELEALRPYLSGLPDELQNSFRVEIGKRSFGQAEMSALSGSDMSPATLADLFKSKEARELAVSIIQAIKRP